MTDFRILARRIAANTPKEPTGGRGYLGEIRRGDHPARASMTAWIEMFDHAEHIEPQSPYRGSSPLAFQIGAVAGAVSAWIKARAAPACLALVVMPAE